MPDPVRELGGEICVACLDVPGQSHGDFLKHPSIAIRIAERGVGGITFSLRIWAADQGFAAGVMEYAAGVMERLADFDTTAQQFDPNGLNVRDDQVQRLR